MKERQILFSAPMVRALLDGSKTQTRRVLALPSWAVPDTLEISNDGLPYAISTKTGCMSMIPCPYGYRNERLWVRETWQLPSPRWDGPQIFPFPADVPIRFDADGVIAGMTYRGNWGKKRPSIHMPRNLCRLVLDISGVRAERLQDISFADAAAEGVVQFKPEHVAGLAPCSAHRYAFEDLWRSINGPRSWDENPWVWVVEFHRTNPHAA